MFICHRPESDREGQKQGTYRDRRTWKEKIQKDSRIYSITLKLNLDQLKVKLVFNVLLRQKKKNTAYKTKKLKGLKKKSSP